MDIEALNQFSKDEFVALLLAQEGRIAVNSSSSPREPSTGAHKGHPGETLCQVEKSCEIEYRRSRINRKNRLN